MSKLERPETIRALWRWSLIALAILAALDLVYLCFPHEAGEAPSPHAMHTHFVIDTYGFYTWFGFLSCLALILFSKGVGVFLKRKDTYYDDE